MRYTVNEAVTTNSSVRSELTANHAASSSILKYTDPWTAPAA